MPDCHPVYVPPNWMRWGSQWDGQTTELDGGKQSKSEGFDSYDRPSNLTQIGFESSIFQLAWPRNLMDDPEKL